MVILLADLLYQIRNSYLVQYFVTFSIQVHAKLKVIIAKMPPLLRNFVLDPYKVLLLDSARG